MTDARIREAIAADPDAASEWTDEDFRRARRPKGRRKRPISIRIDQDVLAWFRTLGPGWQSLVNVILRAYMERHRDSVAAQGAEHGTAEDPAEG
ncbi:MAG: BrnA antitoxin family protein [Geminicoccaceae bacterium]|nr:BrnA antitoxin family protein [Geminicoccaceae bacterium]